MSKQTWFDEQGVALPDLGPRPFIPESKTQTFKVSGVRRGHEKTLPTGQKLSVLLVLEGTVEGRGSQHHEWEVTSKLAAARLRDVLKDGPRSILVRKTGTGTDTAYHIEAAKS